MKFTLKWVYGCWYQINVPISNTYSAEKIENKWAAKTPIAPKMIVTNFKAASFKSLNRNYPGSFQKGCLFHLSQAISKKN